MHARWWTTLWEILDYSFWAIKVYAKGLGLPSWLSGKEPSSQCRRPELDPLEKEMATHSSINAWRIPWTQEPGRLSPWGHRGRHDLATNNNKYQRLMNFLSQMKIIKKKQFVKRIKTREFLLALGRRLQDLCFWFFLALSPTTAALEAAQGSLTLWPMTKNIQCQSHWTLLLFSRYVVFDSLWPHGL